MNLATIRKKRFLQGFKFTTIPSVIIIILTLVAWTIFSSVENYPLGAFALGLGGLAFTVAGCIGPGRYKQDFKLVLYNPRDKGAYHKFIKVSGFTVDDTITEADLYINSTKVETISFENNTFERVYKEEAFLGDSVNYLWLEAGEEKSNRSLISIYDPQDFDEEEILEIEEKEAEEEKYTIEEARDRYLNDRNSGLGYVTLGVITGGALVLFLGILLEFTLFGG